MSVEELWNRHLIVGEDNRQFVDCKLLDEIIGNELLNKYRVMEKLIAEMVAGTELVAKDLIRRISVRNQRKPSVCIAARTMQLILLRGFKNMPWNEARRSLVEYFFPQDVLPYVEPHNARKPMTETAAPDPDPRPSAEEAPSNIAASIGETGERTGAIIMQAIVPRVSRYANTRLQIYVTKWTKPGGAVKFWRQVFWCARHRRISLQGLVDFVRRNANVHHRESRKGTPNLTSILVHGLLSNRGSTRAFCDNLSLAMRTGNADMLINVIRKHLATPGLRTNLVPSMRSIQRSTASIVRNFIALCKPERTFSGFRVDLVSCVKIAAFLLLNISSVNGLRVDIWGDGCEIGGMEITRLTFRLLCDETGPSAQSSDAVFCFAGKFVLTRFMQTVGTYVN